MTPRQLEINQARTHFSIERERVITAFRAIIQREFDTYYNQCKAAGDIRGYEQAEHMLNDMKLPVANKFTAHHLTRKELIDMWVPISGPAIIADMWPDFVKRMEGLSQTNNQL